VQEGRVVRGTVESVVVRGPVECVVGGAPNEWDRTAKESYRGVKVTYLRGTVVKAHLQTLGVRGLVVCRMLSTRFLLGLMGRSIWCVCVCVCVCVYACMYVFMYTSFKN